MLLYERAFGKLSLRERLSKGRRITSCKLSSNKIGTESKYCFRQLHQCSSGCSGRINLAKINSGAKCYSLWKVRADI